MLNFNRKIFFNLCFGLASIGILLLVNACSLFSNKSDKAVIARAFENKLYITDLVNVVPKGTSARDSANLVKNYVENWVKEQVLLHKAETNIDKKNIDIEKQVEEYKNSLVIYAYEKMLINQKLDTIVSVEQISNYYKNNQKEFLLKDNIVKVLYVKLPLKTSVQQNIRNLYKSTEPQNLKSLSDYCEKYAVNYFLDYENWLVFNDLLKEIPIKTYDQEEYLKNHRFIEFQDSTSAYFVNIVDFMIKESVSPLAFETENIRNIIINKRKMQLIRDMHDKVYKDAIKNNDIEIKI